MAEKVTSLVPSEEKLTMALNEYLKSEGYEYTYKQNDVVKISRLLHVYLERCAEFSSTDTVPFLQGVYKDLRLLQDSIGQEIRAVPPRKKSFWDRLKVEGPEQKLQKLDLQNGLIGAFLHDPFSIIDSYLFVRYQAICDKLNTCDLTYAEPDAKLIADAEAFERSIELFVKAYTEIGSKADVFFANVENLFIGYECYEKVKEKKAKQKNKFTAEPQKTSTPHAAEVKKIKTAYLDEVVGQVKAKQEIVSYLKGRVFKDDERPDVLLFLGPTGVGKTEMAKAICKSIYGEETKPCLIDISQMHDASHINNIVGSPMGYVGSDKPPVLLEYVQAHPNGGVIILDEFEKCNSQVKTAFMNMFGEGTLNVRGKMYDVSNFTFVATSNAGQDGKKMSKVRVAGFTSSLEEKKIAELPLTERLQKAFPAELLGRMKLVEFEDLSLQDYSTIAEKYVNRVLAKIFAREHLSVKYKLDPSLAAACAQVAQKGKFGVRGMYKLIEQQFFAKLVDFFEEQDKYVDFEATVATDDCGKSQVVIKPMQPVKFQTASANEDNENE